MMFDPSIRHDINTGQAFADAIPIVAREEVERRQIWREIERLERERALQGPAPVAEKRQGAFAAVAVEFNVERPPSETTSLISRELM